MSETPKRSVRQHIDRHLERGQLVNILNFARQTSSPSQARTVTLPVLLESQEKGGPRRRVQPRPLQPDHLGFNCPFLS